MSAEELMKPRFKVIADYPGNVHKIGTILSEPRTNVFNILLHLHPEKYPAIFKRLDWWEDREESEMPEYVKKGNGDLRKVKQHFCNSYGDSIPFGCQLEILGEIQKTFWNYFPYSTLTPATEPEVLNHINQQ